MACCLTAPSHYLRLGWLLISGILWYSYESNFTTSAQATILYPEFEKFASKIAAPSPRSQWVPVGWSWAAFPANGCQGIHWQPVSQELISTGWMDHWAWNEGSCSDVCSKQTLSAMMLPGQGWSWTTGLAGISELGPNSEPHGNNWSFPETRERAHVPVKKIGSSDLIFGLVNSTFFKITNHNQHAFNIKYLANLIKKYWTCFRYQKLGGRFSGVLPAQRPRTGPVATILENLLEDPT